MNVTVDRVTTTPRASAEIGLAGGTQSPRPDSRTSALPGLALQTQMGTRWGSRTHLSTEWPVALAAESQGEVLGARTPSITPMRLPAQHLFLLNDTPKASGFCPLEACLGPFFPLFCKIKGAGVAGT